MSAITINGKNLNLSLAYDGLTIYFNFDLPDMFHAWNMCAKSIALIGELNVCTEIMVKQEFDRYIHRDDDDHSFYHQDSFPIEHDHSHIKFLKPITRAKLDLLVGELEKHGLISTDEKTKFLSRYDERNREALLSLRGALSGTRDVEIDTREIINYLRTCKDNDVITYLHDALLAPRFDYLRQVTSASTDKRWQGTNADGKLVETSKHWAMIQKAISLQLANNIRVECGTFSSKVAHERADQLLKNVSFFALKRKGMQCTTELSSTFKAFSAKDEATFTGKYEKHFGKYK